LGPNQFTLDEAKALLRKAIDAQTERGERNLTADDLRCMAEDLGLANEVIEEILARPERTLVQPRPALPKPTRAASIVRKAADELVLETPPAGWNEISSFPLLFGAIWLLTGMGGLYAGIVQFRASSGHMYLDRPPPFSVYTSAGVEFVLRASGSQLFSHPSGSRWSGGSESVLSHSRQKSCTPARR
jgi:hypothetical protein